MIFVFGFCFVSVVGGVVFDELMDVDWLNVILMMVDDLGWGDLGYMGVFDIVMLGFDGMV